MDGRDAPGEGKPHVPALLGGHWGTRVTAQAGGWVGGRGCHSFSDPSVQLMSLVTPDAAFFSLTRVSTSAPHWPL